MSWRTDPEKRRAYKRAYYQLNKAKERARANAYWKAHDDERHAYYVAHRSDYRTYHQTYRLKVKTQAFQAYGGLVCACCGDTHIEFLTIDHVAGKGRAHREQISSRGGYAFYMWLKKHGYPLGYRVLCFNCNLSLGAFGYCPHGNLPSTSERTPEDTQRLPLFESVQSPGDSQ